MKFYELPPQINSRFHYITNGVIWTGAGINMMILAIGWYLELNKWQGILSGLVTFSMGILIANLRFKKIVHKFNNHIQSLPDRSWFFSFQALKHYFLLVFMMTLGLTLRHYSGLDVFILAIIYMTMGTTLVISSYHFYIQIILTKNHETTSNDST